MDTRFCVMGVSALSDSRMYRFFLALVLLSAPAAQAQIERVSAVPDNAAGSSPAFTEYEGALYFSGFTPATGRELARYSEAGGYEIAADVLPGTDGSQPSNLTVYDGALYFSAFTPAAGNELFRYTEADGAVLVAEVTPGPDGSFMDDFVVYDGRLYFSATNTLGNQGNELYAYSPTTGLLFFNLDDEPNNIPGSDSGSFPENLTVYDGALYFSAESDDVSGFELHRYTIAGGATVIDIESGSSGSFPTDLTVYDGALYFNAGVFGTGDELWRYTVAGGAEIVQDLNPGPDDSDPVDLAVYDGALYFAINDGPNQNDLFRYTAAEGIDSGPRHDDGREPVPRDLTVYDGVLYFEGRSGATGSELFRYTPATGARLVGEVFVGTGNSFLRDFVVYDGALYFTARDSRGDRGVYRFQTPAVRITGTEGWRMLAAPAIDESLSAFLSPIWTQGFPGADFAGGTPSVLFYDESATGPANDGYTPPEADARLGAGRGVFTFVYADDDLDGSPDPFPKTLRLTGAEPTLPFTFDALSFTPSVPAELDDDGWNLLGNPVRVPLLWRFVWRAQQTSNVSPTVYVYDAATNAYQTYHGAFNFGDLPNGEIPAGSGMWVKATGPNPALTAPEWAVNRGEPEEATPHLALRLDAQSDAGEALGSAAFVAFHADAEWGRDALDAPSLASPDAAQVRLVAVDQDGQSLAIAALPSLDGRADSFEVDLRTHAAGAAAQARLSWTNAFPDGWTATLLDRQTGEETALESASDVQIELGDGTSDRFALRFARLGAVSGEEAAAETSVSAVWPNPAAQSAQIRLTLAAPETVRATVIDALGREVAVAYDGLASGTLALRLGADRLAPGAYAVRIEGASFAETRTFVVVR